MVADKSSSFVPPLTWQQMDDLREITTRIVQPGKGILAADDTNEGMATKLEPLGLKNTAENRRIYKQLLFTTPNLGKHVSAVILFDETFHQVRRLVPRSKLRHRETH
ncbi:aldolase [Aphelenchoides avenae]|nr:aldolase [Aphelenchus avenae]